MTKIVIVRLIRKNSEKKSFKVLPDARIAVERRGLHWVAFRAATGNGRRLRSKPAKFSGECARVEDAHMRSVLRRRRAPGHGGVQLALLGPGLESQRAIRWRHRLREKEPGVSGRAAGIPHRRLRNDLLVCWCCRCARTDRQQRNNQRGKLCPFVHRYPLLCGNAGGIAACDGRKVAN